MNERHSARALLGGFSVLVIGAVLGIAFDRVILLASPAEAQPPAAHTVAGDHARALADLAEHLELSGSQRQHVHNVFMKHQDAINQAWLSMRQQLFAVVDSVTAEIEVVLDGAQKRRLHEWIAERHGDPPHRPAPPGD
ncbi:MAG: hypothetical protein L0271_14380 [Gemmatimonadetes bacterium]|nr:hypothetical protein [Gemmatimonadota bacterium]